MVGYDNWNGKEFEISQHGSHSWNGKVTVWQIGGYKGAESLGRKSEGPASGNWKKGDRITLQTCKKPSKIYILNIIHIRVLNQIFGKIEKFCAFANF